MSSLLNYLLGTNGVPDVKSTPDDRSVAVAESITAGALANTLCSEPGSSRFFKGGIVAYSIASKKEILHIDVQYAEKNNFANPFTTLEMAKAAAKMFNSRIGISTTGYSLPLKRDASDSQCALDIKTPYAYICLYDALLEKEIIRRVEFEYYTTTPDNIQRASVQTKVALEGKKMYQEYIRKLNII